MAQKPTIREFLHAVTEGDTSLWVQEFAEERIQKLDEKNAKRAEKSSEKREENLELLPTVLEVFYGEVLQVSKIAKRLEAHGIELTSPKITALMKLGVETGQVEKIVPEKRTAPLEYKVIE